MICGEDSFIWPKPHEDVLTTATEVKLSSKSQLISEAAPISWWLSWLSSMRPIGRSQPGCTVKAAVTRLLFLLPLQAALRPTSTPAPAFHAMSDWISVTSAVCHKVFLFHHLRDLIMFTALILSPLTLLQQCFWRKGLKVNVSHVQADKPLI